MDHEPLPKLLSRMLENPKLAQTRVFIDTCFILNKPAFAALDDAFFMTLSTHKNPLVLPLAVLREVMKHAGDPVDVTLAETARAALNRLKLLMDSKAIRQIGADKDPFADQTFLQVFTTYRPRYNLLLLTQDGGLSRDLLRINDNESTDRTHNKIFVGRFFPSNQIIVFNDVADYKRMTSRKHPAGQKNHPAAQPTKPPPSTHAFRTCTKPRRLDPQVLGNGAEYTTGAKLSRASGKSVTLGDSIARGGEGEVFSLGTSEVAKIYFHDRRTRARRDKLQLMCSNPLHIVGVSWPTDILHGADGQFVGYVMPKGRGRPLQHSVFGKAALAKSFPDWNRRNLVEIALTYAQTVAWIHTAGLLVGDINPMNVLVASSNKIHLVDVDSFQVEDFPCPVGMATFRAPEITDTNYSTFLRTERHESFALTSLLFMILMGGKSPYSYQGGGDPAENIRQGNFPYVKDAHAIPAGAYRYIWSYFPQPVQNAFAATFAYSDPQGRPTADEWVGLLENYLKSLDREPTESDAYALWPASFRPWKTSQVVQLRCASCQTFFQTSKQDADKRSKFPSILCGNCIAALSLAKKAGGTVPCPRCHRNQVPMGSAADRQVHCESCLEEASRTRRQCKQCASEFFIEPGEIAFFQRKSLAIPRRCGPCRGQPAYYPPAYTAQQAPPQVTQSPYTNYYAGHQPNYTPAPPPPAPPAQRTIWDLLVDLFS